MSITVTCDVFCDVCDDWVAGVSGRVRTAYEDARKVAREAGWYCKRGRDVCPRCLKKEKGEG